MTVLVNTIGANLRRLRSERRLSLVELSSRSGVARATLANLEQGRGNPTIETLWALALGLGVAFSDLLEENGGSEVEIVRADEGPRVGSGTLDLRLLDRLERGRLTEVLEFRLTGRHEGGPHGPGVVESVHLWAGRMLAGPADDAVELAAGDYARYPADRPHVYEALAGEARGVLLVDYPPA